MHDRCEMALAAVGEIESAKRPHQGSASTSRVRRVDACLRLDCAIWYIVFLGWGSGRLRVPVGKLGILRGCEVVDRGGGRFRGIFRA